MRNEFTAIVEKDEEWFIAYSPGIPGADGRGRTKNEALSSLSDAISLALGIEHWPRRAGIELERDSLSMIEVVAHANHVV